MDKLWSFKGFEKLRISKTVFTDKGFVTFNGITYNFHTGKRMN
ncbi:hypothetical protein [Eggerthia catenaformis]